MKLRATGKAGWTWMARAWLLAWAVYLPLPGWLEAAVTYGTLTVFLMGATALGVWAACNAGAAREALARRAGKEEAPVPEWHDRMSAFQAAVALSMTSMSELRYAGPPPVYRTYQEVTEYLYVTGQGSLTARGRVTRSECEECGIPLDVAWCTPSTDH